MVPHNTPFLDPDAKAGTLELERKADTASDRTSLRQNLERFVSLERHVQHARLARSILLGLLASQLSLLLFLVDGNPHLFAMAVSVGLVALPILLVLGTIVVVLHRHLGKLRNSLARQFFEMGLRVDDRARLLTNVAHPTVVATL